MTYVPRSIPLWQCWLPVDPTHLLSQIAALVIVSGHQLACSASGFILGSVLLPHHHAATRMHGELLVGVKRCAVPRFVQAFTWPIDSGAVGDMDWVRMMLQAKQASVPAVYIVRVTTFCAGYWCTTGGGS